MEPGSSSDAGIDVALARRQRTDAMHMRTASAKLQSDAKLHTPETSQRGPQRHRNKLALKPSVTGQSCHKGETETPVTDLHGQLKPKTRKKNRLGQRARQQLGRAKEAQFVKERPRNTFKVDHTPKCLVGVHKHACVSYKTIFVHPAARKGWQALVSLADSHCHSLAKLNWNRHL